MQFDFDINYSQLDIQILGMNAVGYEAGNDWFTSNVNIPWLQDVDSDGNLLSDVWDEWQVGYRDVVILDKENVPAGTFNLTTHDLQYWENYSALRQMFISTATGADFNLDGDVDGADFLAWQRGESPYPLSALDLADWEANYGAAAAQAVSTAVPEPGTAMLMLFPLAALLFFHRRGHFHHRDTEKRTI